MTDKVKIDKDGMYPNVDIEDYHGDLCVGFSTSHSPLETLFAKSPAHFWDQSWMNEDAEERKVTDAMNLGRACHHLFMGEKNFNKHYVRRPEKAPDGSAWNGNKTICKDWIAKQNKDNLTIISPDQIDKIVRMKTSLEKEPMVQAGVLSGQVEQSFVWKDKETGIWLKARPDVIPSQDTGDFADLKCVSDISDNGIMKIIGNFGYHRQAALVLEGAHHVLGTPLDLRGPGENGMSVSLVFIETTRPHCVEVITIRPSDLKDGMEENRLALNLLKRCLDDGEWPGPSGYQRDARYAGITKWVSENNAYRCKQIESFLAVGGTKAPTEIG